jgi:hypothetical protein
MKFNKSKPSGTRGALHAHNCWYDPKSALTSSVYKPVQFTREKLRRFTIPSSFTKHFVQHCRNEDFSNQRHLTHTNMPSTNTSEIASIIAHAGAWAATTLEPVDDTELLATSQTSSYTISETRRDTVVFTSQAIALILAKYQPNTK